MMGGENELRETYVPITSYKMDTNFIVVAGDRKRIMDLLDWHKRYIRSEVYLRH